jgi:hypothetical protein
MRSVIITSLVIVVILGLAGCRFENEKYWGMPASYGLSRAMERGFMPEGWIQFYVFTGFFDLLLMPVTLIHDFIVMVFDPPRKFKWEEQRELRQMLYGY